MSWIAWVIVGLVVIGCVIAYLSGASRNRGSRSYNRRRDGGSDGSDLAVGSYIAAGGYERDSDGGGGGESGGGFGPWDGGESSGGFGSWGGDDSGSGDSGGGDGGGGDGGGGDGGD